MLTTTVNTNDAKDQFSELINRVMTNKERIVLTRRGKEVAVLISFEDLKLLQESQDKSDVEHAMDSLKEARQTGLLTLTQLKEKVGVPS